MTQCKLRAAFNDLKKRFVLFTKLSNPEILSPNYQNFNNRFKQKLGYLLIENTCVIIILLVILEPILVRPFMFFCYFLTQKKPQKFHQTRSTCIILNIYLDDAFKKIGWRNCSFLRKPFTLLKLKINFEAIFHRTCNYRIIKQSSYQLQHKALIEIIYSLLFLNCFENEMALEFLYSI